MNDKKLFESFNKFIKEQGVTAREVCQFVYSLLDENGYSYIPTKCGPECALEDN